MNGFIHTKIYVRHKKHRPTLTKSIEKDILNRLPSLQKKIYIDSSNPKKKTTKWVL